MHPVEKVFFQIVGVVSGCPRFRWSACYRRGPQCHSDSPLRYLCCREKLMEYCRATLVSSLVVSRLSRQPAKLNACCSLTARELVASSLRLKCPISTFFRIHLFHAESLIWGVAMPDQSKNIRNDGAFVRVVRMAD